MSVTFRRASEATVDTVEGGALATVDGRIFRLNETAAAVWDLLDRPMTFAELTAACAATFVVSDSFVGDLQALLTGWLDVGLVQRG